MKNRDNNGYLIPYPKGIIVECIYNSISYKKEKLYKVEKSTDSHFWCMTEQGKLSPCSYDWHFKVYTCDKDLHTLIKEILC